MQENNPNNIHEQPPSPEQIAEMERQLELAKKQRAASEMLTAIEEQSQPPKPGVPFNTGASDRLAEQATQALKLVPKPTPEIPAHEIGLPLAEVEALHRNPLEWINKTINRKDLNPNQAMLGLIEATEEQDRKDLPRAV